MESEIDILKALSNNNTKAYEKLYEDYFAMVRYFILKNSGTVDEAKDVFQDAILVLYEKTKNPDFSLSCTLKTYLYSIVRNLWLKALAKKKKTISLNNFEKYYSLDIPEENSEKNSKINSILEAIKSLGDNCKKILTSFYFQRKKMVEIANDLGYTNAENAKNQKYKCMQQLKKLVK